MAYGKGNSELKEKKFLADNELIRIIDLLKGQYKITMADLFRMLIMKEARFAGLLDYEGQRKPGT